MTKQKDARFFPGCCCIGCLLNCLLIAGEGACAPQVESSRDTLLYLLVELREHGKQISQIRRGIEQRLHVRRAQALDTRFFINLKGHEAHKLISL